MNRETSDRMSTLKSGFDALLACHQALDHCIAAERRRSLPDVSVLRLLGSEKLRLQRELLRYDGLFRTLSRGRGAA